jgi:hypothetical protein
VKSDKDISTLFPQHLFWDVDTRKLDVERDSELIISRALYMTNEKSFPEDIAKLEQLYSSRKIIEKLQNTKEKISNIICKMVAERYSIPPFYRFKPNA